MHARSGLVITSLIAIVALIMVLPPADDASAAPANYTFDSCAEGWTTATNNAAVPNNWIRSAPGQGGSGQAFRIQPYPPGLGSPDDTWVATLTAPIHQVPGGPMKVTWFVAHDTEETYDFLYLESSADGKTWAEVDKVHGLSAGYPNFIAKESTVDAAPGALHLRFRFTSDQNLTFSGVAVDTVSIPAERPAGTECAGGGGGSPAPTSTGTASPSPSPTSSPSPTPRCTITGTDKGETLRGTQKADRICGKGGNDTLLGKGGNDLLNGGTGKDVCKGGPGRDKYKSCERKS